MTGQPSGVTRLGRHVLHEVVARDLATVTYRATALHDRGPQPVALRVVSRAVAADGDAVASYLHAAGQAAAIDHPHVLRTLDAGTHDGQAYVATVWREGMSLAQLLAAHEPLPAWVVVRVGGQIAEALDALHDHGVVHGTLGAHAVWMKARRRGQSTASAAITAFGTSHLLAAALRTAGDADVAEDLFGVAPEQISHGTTDASSDQYALACLLFQALTGAPVFAAATNKALLQEHLHASPLAVTDLRPDLDPRWDAVVRRALDKDPAARYENCRTLLRAVGRCAQPRDEPARAAQAVAWVPRAAAGDRARSGGADGRARSGGEGDRARSGGEGDRARSGGAPAAPPPVVATGSSARARASRGRVALRVLSVVVFAVLVLVSLRALASARTQAPGAYGPGGCATLHAVRGRGAGVSVAGTHGISCAVPRGVRRSPTPTQRRRPDVPQGTPLDATDE